MNHLMLNKKLQKLCKRNKVTGANVALYNDKEILYSYNYGYANKAENIKSTNDSLYMIGSNTKVMTAIGILKLMEDGKLSLNDDIKKFIPEFEVKSNFEYDKITIENLLMHRSGIVCDLFHLILDRTRDYHEVIEELKETYLTSIPDHMFSYSNIGYTLLGIIIERISGLSYTDYIKKVIAKPLGIEIHFLLNEKDREPFASRVSLCYDKKGKPVEDYLSTLLPAGSNTYLSLNDFVKFGQIFLNKENTILHKETLDLMESLNIHELIDCKMQNVGYGLFHNQYNYGEKVGRVLGHGGNTSCHHSMFNYIPSLNIGVIVTTNSEQAAELFGELGQSVLTEHLKEKELIEEELSLEHKYVKADTSSYIGKFATALGPLDIKLNNKNELVSKISKIPVKLLTCEDGYLQCYPINLLHKLPPFKKAIMKVRAKITTYFGEEVLIIEQTEKYFKTKGFIGCRYEHSFIPDFYKEACGNYQVDNENLKHLNCKCSLKLEDDMLVLRIEALNAKMYHCLKVIDENLAITQGFGRNAKQVVKFEKKNDDIYLTYSGIVFKKR